MVWCGVLSCFVLQLLSTYSTRSQLSRYQEVSSSSIVLYQLQFCSYMKKSSLYHKVSFEYCSDSNLTAPRQLIQERKHWSHTQPIKSGWTVTIYNQQQISESTSKLLSFSLSLKSDDWSLEFKLKIQTFKLFSR